MFPNLWTISYGDAIPTPIITNIIIKIIITIDKELAEKQSKNQKMYFWLQIYVAQVPPHDYSGNLANIKGPGNIETCKTFYF